MNRYDYNSGDSDLDSDTEMSSCNSGCGCSSGRSCGGGSRRSGDSGSSLLQFDPTSLENIILKIADSFDIRVILGTDRVKGAMIVTTGMAIAGGLIGNHYGGKMGAAIGTAVAGACGLGIVAVSMREAWNDIKSQLPEVYDIVYDYLSGLGIEDYKKAALFVTQKNGSTTELVMILVQFISSTLGKQVLSSLQPALGI